MKISAFIYLLLFVAFLDNSVSAQQLPELIDMRTDGTAIFSCAGILLAAAHIKGLSSTDHKKYSTQWQKEQMRKISVSFGTIFKIFRNRRDQKHCRY
jgi:hypothetical protein